MPALLAVSYALLGLRIGDETDRRVEGEQGIDCREIELVQRQPILERQDQINDDRHRQIGDEHVNRIRPPCHSLCGDASADQKIYRVVNRIEDPVELRWPAHHDSRHVASQGDADKKDGEQGG